MHTPVHVSCRALDRLGSVRLGLACQVDVCGSEKTRWFKLEGPRRVSVHVQLDYDLIHSDLLFTSIQDDLRTEGTSADICI